MGAGGGLADPAARHAETSPQEAQAKAEIKRGAGRGASGDHRPAGAGEVRRVEGEGGGGGREGGAATAVVLERCASGGVTLYMTP
jgi:hypothetical protein